MEVEWLALVDKESKTSECKEEQGSGRRFIYKQPYMLYYSPDTFKAAGN
jgi:hypothetical protein